jgi:hypothetical protein
MFTAPDRRKRRSSDVREALRYQLAACCEDARLDAMVLSDEDGLCLAASGTPATTEEVAAALPILGRRAGDFHGVLLSGHAATKLLVHRFRHDTSELYLAAVGDDEELCVRQIARSLQGLGRILARPPGRDQKLARSSMPSQ